MTSYNPVTKELADRLLALLGSDRFAWGDGVNQDYARDEMPIYGQHAPEAVCLAETTEEAAAVMKFCAQAKVPVTPRGAGTGLVGGCVPWYGGVVLCTARMNKILAYDLNNLSVRVQAGVLLQDLQADALTHGLFYPPDPGEKMATIGGNVSTNAGGMRAVKYGVTRDYVLAMTVVLPDGRVMELGRAVTKTSSGYNLLQLIIGSEGTLALVTEITLRLLPAPAADLSLILPFPDVATCIEAVPAIRLANLDPQSIEFMDADIVESSAAFTKKPVFPTKIGGKPVGASLLVTLAGDDLDSIYPRVEKLAGLAATLGAYDTLLVEENRKKAVWEARGSFLTAIEADTRYVDEMDVVVPVEHIAKFLGYVRATGEATGLTIRNFGHAGDGNLHIYCCSNDLEEAEFKARAKRVMDLSYARCAELGGQVSGEHAIGYAKKTYLRESVGDPAYQLMRAIKNVFDPDLILNPGKVCTDLD